VPPVIEMVLFDFGGVLVELRRPVAVRESAGIESDAELWRRWLTCRWARAFESGQCSDVDFAHGEHVGCPVGHSARACAVP
jgi:hypothetical protein